MKTPGRIAAVLACAAALSTVVLSQTPARDTALARRGTAAIGGIVVTAGPDSHPLRRVTVTLQSGTLSAPRSTTTDDRGAFRFDALVPGNYTLAASRPGYVRLVYGATHFGMRQGVPVGVTDGQQLTNLTLPLVHGAVLTGTVAFENRQPAAGLPVQVVSVTTVNGERRIDYATFESVTTDDRGVYRVFGLPPGAFLVLARASGGAAAEMRRVTAEEVQWAQRATAETSGAPGAPPASAPPPAPPAGPRLGYAPVYYPGTTHRAEAVAVTLAPGEERAGLDFPLSFVPLASITGKFVDAGGQSPTSASLTLIPAEADLANLFGLMPGQASARTSADGTFTIDAVPPGRYTLNARANAAGDAAPANPSPMAGLPASASALFGGAPSATLWGSEIVDVSGQDQAGVVIHLRPGLTITGRVVFDGGTPATPADVARTRMILLPATSGTSPLDMVGSILGGGLAAVAVNPDGTFTAKNVMPNRYRLTVAGPPIPGASGVARAWSLRSAVINGHDIADLPLEVRPDENVSGLVVTMTDRTAELSGTVIDRAGRPVSNFPVVVFSTDRAYWAVGSRRVQQGSVTTDGKFSFTTLPPGDYNLCLATDVDPSSLYDPAFLDQLAPGAVRVSIAEGGKTVQDVRIGR